MLQILGRAAPILLLLALSACEREQADPFAVPGAVRMQIQYVTFSEGEEIILRSRAGRALTQVEDPCGRAPGPTGLSYAWVRAETIAAGHDREMVCTWSTRTDPEPSPPDRTPTDEERIASRARLAMKDAYLGIMERGNAEQVRFINALPADDQPTPTPTPTPSSPPPS